VLKGSERSATKSVFSEVQFGGVDQAAFQQMVNECYKDFVDQLSAAGLDITNGDELMATDYAQDIMNNGKKNDFAGKSPGKPFETKKRIDEGGIAGYGVWSVTRGLNFQPENVNELTTSRRILGNFYNKFIQKEHVNLIQVSYNITFASFDGGRGYKDVSLATKPLLSVNPQVAIYSASGWPTVEMKKGPVFGNDGWSVGLEKIKDNQDDAFLLGLARSADYVLTVDPGKYLPEIKDIIMNYQKALVAEIKSKVK
jgi:hypothetical protein